MSGGHFDPDVIPLPKTGAEVVMADARAQLRAELGAGEQASCPCCGQTAKVYSRTINATMVAALKAITQHHGLDNKAIIASTRQSGGGNASLMQHWGLVRQDAKKRWHATDKGRLFLAGRIEIPSRILIYDNVFLGFDLREEVHVSELGGVWHDQNDIMDERHVQEAQVAEVAA